MLVSINNDVDICMQVKTEVMRRLVLGHDRGGRCRYDPQAKAELIQECMKPGVSVARIAMQHGINANLLRNCICGLLVIACNHRNLQPHCVQFCNRIL